MSKPPSPAPGADLEVSILGTVLLHPEALPLALHHLGPLWDRCWTSGGRQEIARRIREAHREGLLPDFQVIRERLDRRRVPNPSTAWAYLSDQAEGIRILETRCRQLLDHTRRRLFEAETQSALDRLAGESLDRVMPDLRRRQAELYSGNLPVHDAHTLGLRAVEYHAERMANPGITGIPIGFPAVDRATLGLQPGTINPLGARPSHGKSAIAGQIALHAAHLGHPVLVVSHEMTADQFMRRMTCNLSRTCMSSANSGRLNSITSEKYLDAVARIRELPIYIMDAPRAHPEQCTSLLSYLAARSAEKNGLVVIDYLQLERIPSFKGGTRTDEIAQITSLWQATLKETGWTSLVLAQLKRESSGRRPQLADFRESGSIEQDGHSCLLLWREGRDDPDNPDKPSNKAWLGLSKNRDGELAEQWLHFSGFCQQFEIWDDDRHQPRGEREMVQHEKGSIRAQTK